ncbi:MAG: hypothetical protein JSS32_08580 [Verrucomicrobia bacterium]|nr:hypothetical protein [Verrucomicrobiota bacterium]
MSENQDFSAYKAEDPNGQLDPMAVMPARDQTDSGDTRSLKEIEESLDGQSYFLGEVPQQYQVDPQAFLPLNSDRLIGEINMTEKLMLDVSSLIQEEIAQIQRLQKKITFWEDRIEKNKAAIQKNLLQIKHTNEEIIYDKKNQDYWWGRADAVNIDYQAAEAARRVGDWGWLIKKWGLKNADGTEIDPTNSCVEELCNGEARNLEGEYRTKGNKYQQAKKDKEMSNRRLIGDNARLLDSNDTLQTYISATYMNEIEPYQDGVLLLKELVIKLKALGAEGQKATYGELRSWAENFLNEFLKTNPRVHFALVTEFRKFASIPLPAENC